MKHLYFKNSFVCIYYDRELHLGKATWHGDLVGSEYREAILLCLDLIDRHELVGWLGDNRKMKSIRPDDLNWSMRVFVPQLLESPLLRLANLSSEHEANRQAVDTMYNKSVTSNGNLSVRSFNEEQEAEAWLMQLADSRQLRQVN